MSNVINLFKKEAAEVKDQIENEDEFDFSAIMLENQRKKQKLKKEQEEANRKVIRQYRLKTKKDK